MQFLGYIISLWEICIKDKKIKVIKYWLNLLSIQDIYLFLGFINFYQGFIQDLFTSILKTTKVELLVENLKPIGNSNTIDRIGDDNKVGRIKSKVDS